MNKAKYIFLTLLALAISIITVILQSTSYVYYEAQNVYRVYLNGNSLGIIESKKELENYVNKKQEALKEKYNVDNVYIPQGLKIVKETTYNEKTESVQEIYNKISNEEDFTINGYTVTITDMKESEKESKRRYKYSKNKRISIRFRWKSTKRSSKRSSKIICKWFRIWRLSKRNQKRSKLNRRINRKRLYQRTNINKKR